MCVVFDTEDSAVYAKTQRSHSVDFGSTLHVSQLGSDFLVLDEADDFVSPAEAMLSVITFIGIAMW
jgi:hypothetical protein